VGHEEAVVLVNSLGYRSDPVDERRGNPDMNRIVPCLGHAVVVDRTSVVRIVGEDHHSGDRGLFPEGVGELPDLGREVILKNSHPNASHLSVPLVDDSYYYILDSPLKSSIIGTNLPRFKEIVLESHHVIWRRGWWLWNLVGSREAGGAGSISSRGLQVGVMTTSGHVHHLVR
jgi:hypothetical protein